MKRTPYSKFKNKQEKNLDPLFYLSNYRYGGGTTFTAHLLHILKRKYIICISEAFERNIGHFGYGVLYKREHMKFLYDLEKMFITNMYQNFHLLDCLRAKDITIVIHAPGEISKENESYLKHWRIIVIRKALQMFLWERYHIKAKFLYHPFYLYKKFKKNMSEQNESNRKDHAVAISRIDYFKNTDIVLKANKGDQ
jgi:hypothetical protein